MFTSIVLQTSHLGLMITWWCDAGCIFRVLKVRLMWADALLRSESFLVAVGPGTAGLGGELAVCRSERGSTAVRSGVP